ncbi:nitrogenase-specific transcriptional regulator NifA [Desulfocucumis palustris]|uniref:Nitrogenase-specific transcriptional regulator NifA n=1 Tax=Desulfocucumis palustris TaxID=1898651 RepID=A0A2L2XAR0_9FIRM|nr:sigma-54-dependent Fis family transcriptional regulator [Desulfocucumis palustris]GBF33064.1 nitrogenase-specific transcriptional regulator NifA [Desulfocucumis palustris]
MFLKDMIKSDPPRLYPGDTLEKAARLFRHAKVDSLPVVDPGNRVIGILTRTNFLDALLEKASLDTPIDSFYNNNAMTVSGSVDYETVKEIVKTSPVGSAPVLDAGGHLAGIFTKADMVLTLLKKSDLLNAQLSAILNAMQNAVVAVDAEKRITLLNSSAEKLLGLKGQDAAGRHYRKILGEIGLEASFLGTAQLGLKHKINGSATIVNILPIISRGTVNGTIVVFQDLTEFEQVARELEIVKNLNQTLDTVLNIIYDGIVVVDGSGIVTLINQVLADYLGVNPGDAVGCYITDILPNSRLHIVAGTGIPELSEIQTIRGKELIVSRLPVIKDGLPTGAVGKVIFPQLAEIKELAAKLNSLQNKIAYYREELRKTGGAKFAAESMIAVSRPMKMILDECRQIAASGSTVLVSGESGTGKELVARAIHNFSPRSNGPFISVNCAAIPENLLESEIFGYAPGAFTGADKNGKPGRFELADGGILFLDEIGDMSLNLQSKLLRVIQEREFVRVGGTRTVHVDVRIIAATNKNLQASMESGDFREDLYYRLNVINIRIPPLRERPEDIEPLARYFVGKFNHILKTAITGISQEAMEVLLKYRWPGNVRELENVIERAANFLREGNIRIQHLPAYMLRAESSRRPGQQENLQYRDRIKQTERDVIISALEKAGGNKTKAARTLNMSRSRLYAKIKELNIPL